jgi:glycosyltransferase involved in cell wall biosynthesis
MKILYLTYSQVGDQSFGGAIRANAIRNALIEVADIDTLVVDGGGEFLLDPVWGQGRVRRASISRYGLSKQGIIQRNKLKRWVHGIIASGAYDIIVAQRLDLATLIPVSARPRMIFDPDDFIKSVGPNTPISKRIKFILRNWMSRRVARQSAHVWYSNPAKDQLPPVVSRSFLPNIAPFPDADRTRPDPIPGRLVMVGLFAHQPNAEGLTWFHDHVLPKLKLVDDNVELHAIGNSSQDLRDSLPNVNFRGFVDVLSYEYDKASLVIAPILSGGGTQIKVIDALAHGRPLVVSRFTHRGFSENLFHEDHLLVADSVEDWVRSCTHALSNQANVAAMAKRGELAVRNNYGSDQLVRIVSATIDSL